MARPRVVDPPASALSEREWVAGVRAGDEAAFEALFRAHYAGLCRFAQRLVGDSDTAEDLVHDVLFGVWEHRTTWDVRDGVRAYLYGATRNRAIDVLRHEQAGRRWQARVAAPRAFGVLPGGAPHGGGPVEPRGPVALLEEAELSRAIERAVESLPERCRQAFRLHREQELSYAEVAAVMGTTAATVKTQMGRALRVLRAAVGPFLALALGLLGRPR